jgi:hypothetical protein
MEESTPYPKYVSLAATQSYTAKKNNAVAVVLSAGATASWQSENGTTGNISVSMVLGPYTQTLTITAVNGEVELIVNGNVQLSGSDAQQQSLNELEQIQTKLNEGTININMEELSTLMRHSLAQALARNAIVSGTAGAQRVVLVNGSGAVVGDNLTNISTLASISVRDGLYSPTDRILWSQSVRSKIS